MQKKVLLLHGWGGSDFPHWQSWLASELVKDYGCVHFLRFSNFDEPKFDIWLNELEKTIDDFKPNIVICHSLANTLWFHLCNTKEIKSVEKLYLVAPPSMSCDIEELREFFPVKIPTNLYAKNVQLVMSRNDPYMNEEVVALQNKLGAPTKILEDAGHINSDSGYGKWGWILKDVVAS